MRTVMGVFMLASVSVVAAGAQPRAENQGPIAAPEFTLQQPAAPRIEVVFVLDTTGSMSKLIHAAKEKIWAIASMLASAQTAPEIRLGLVAFRDRRDAYVTQLVPLDRNLDGVYGQLMLFKTGGGGDGPESVNQALHEAVTKFDWSKGAGGVYRAIFLVGDAPPHMDYADDVKYPTSCELAAKQGILINAVQCGSDTSTEPIWRDIAQKSGGEYFQVKQGGSAVLTETPYDHSLALLSKQLDRTRVYYGDRDTVATQNARIDAADRIHARASTAARARRAEYSVSATGRRDFAGLRELVKDYLEGRLDLATLNRAELPEELRNMTDEELIAFLERIRELRESLQRHIQDLSESRQAHIRRELARQPQTAGSLDALIWDCIVKQAAASGIEYAGGPTF